jgi:hypothetical protein
VAEGENKLRTALPAWRLVAIALIVSVLAAVAPRAIAQSRQLAPDFTVLPSGQKLLLMPVDVELFSLSAGGIPEPRADWTQAAQRHMGEVVRERFAKLQLQTVTMTETEADPFAEQVALHAAVARSIDLHHGIAGGWALPSKNGKLDWSFADAMRPLQQATGARYGLFIWVRDSYASAERVATMVVFALLGVGIQGGMQVGYSTLVDLETGQVLWFNRLARGGGDLRDAKRAAETMETLFSGFPGVQ